MAKYKRMLTKEYACENMECLKSKFNAEGVAVVVTDYQTRKEGESYSKFHEKTPPKCEACGLKLTQQQHWQPHEEVKIN